ncbi:hypothetical protein XBKB1_2090002 [Xenorhabdus bovienii str. kraussei Becker Underwood]|uniref:Uncharacterized protein n=1 Tax=Xenorhabdus bovienii str. kraussei Becker Underwood TaxID=1398204 RepID=A0A077PS16_XENBV|nr:hypothetical protein XBKB1_2090002 [Xenorhabdus bovienii str. kraussei Becker Underwood]
MGLTISHEFLIHSIAALAPAARPLGINVSLSLIKEIFLDLELKSIFLLFIFYSSKGCYLLILS